MKISCFYSADYLVNFTYKYKFDPVNIISMAGRKYYKNTVKNVLMILKVLKESEKDGESFLTVSKIAKLTNLHKWTVSRTLDIYMHPYVEMMTPEGFEDVGLQIKFIRLKNPNMDEKQVLRFLKLDSVIKDKN